VGERRLGDGWVEPDLDSPPPPSVLHHCVPEAIGAEQAADVSSTVYKLVREGNPLRRRRDRIPGSASNPSPPVGEASPSRRSRDVLQVLVSAAREILDLLDDDLADAVCERTQIDAVGQSPNRIGNRAVVFLHRP
jgi:hypothetical protein